MKVLIVSTFFPPENSPASLRPYSWAKWFSRQGLDVTVLTVQKPPTPADLKLDCSNFKVIRTPVPIPFFKLRSQLKTTQSHQPHSLKRRLLTRLRQLYLEFCEATGCFHSCRLPNWHDLWALKAYKHVKNQYWDLVISTGGPYSVHHIPLALKKNAKLSKWVVDWRDLWTQNHIYRGLPLLRLLEKHLEKKIHQTADLITTVSEPLARQLQTITTTKVAVIYNGFDPEEFTFLTSRARRQNPNLHIVYTGTIYKNHRDPSPLFDAISQLLKAGLISPERLHITFAGPPNTDLSDLANRYGIKDLFTYAGFLSREDALSLQYDADICLFLESPFAQGVLTEKLFEYLYLAREICAIGIKEDSSAGQLIIRSKAGVVLGTDVEKIKAYIMQKINHPHAPVEKDLQFIEQFNRKNQAMKLLALLFPPQTLSS